MSCDNPQLMWIDSDGKIKYFGSLKNDENMFWYKYLMSNDFDFGHALLVGCGKCLSCRMAEAHVWSVRCRYELESHEDSCFVTLTYRNSSLPAGGSLCRDDYQKFLKRLRKHLDDKRLKYIRDTGVKAEDVPKVIVRYFGCGEYGLKKLRPHYHFIIFGWKPDDLKWFFVRNGHVVYRSAILEKLWPNGFVSVGDVSDSSIKYVCRYTMKKAFQELPKGLLRPFTVCSSRPAIGRAWFEKNWRSSLVKGDSGDIVRYGFPDLENYGHFVDIRYFRKLASRFADEGKLDFGRYIEDVNAFFNDFRRKQPLIDGSELFRRQELSVARVSHITHYERVMPDKVVEEML